MNNVPEFVKWIDDDYVAKATNNVIGRYGIHNINEKLDVENMPLHELRELATTMAEIGYNEELYNKVPYDTQKLIRDRLNKEFNRRLGEEASKIYEMLDKELNKEKWGGEERFKLMNLCNRKGYTEMGVLKNTVVLMHYMGEKMTIENMEVVAKMFKHSIFWEFGYTRNLEGSCTDSKEVFDIHNEARKKEIAAQDTFVDACLEQRFEEAYEMIKDDIEK